MKNGSRAYINHDVLNNEDYGGCVGDVSNRSNYVPQLSLTSNHCIAL